MPPGPAPSRPVGERPDLHARATSRRRELERRAAAGKGGALVLVGEAGIGKSTLLVDAGRDRPGGALVLRTVGHEAEATSAFGGLSRLLWPVRDRVGELEAPVAGRVRAALGIGPTVPGDRFAVGAAVLALLSQLGPTTCVVDDWHVLDPGSRATLAFVARRLASTSVAMVIGTRPVETGELEGLPALDLEVLDTDRVLVLARARGTPVTRPVATELVAATGGNTLAIVEGLAALDDRQRGGRAPLGAITFGTSIVQAFAEPLANLGERARAALQVVAFHADGDPLVVARALSILGFSAGGLPVDELAEFVDVDERALRFRHPLRRAAVAQSMDDAAARRVHRALGEALAALGDDEASSVHLASGSLPPDGDLARRLEVAADRAAGRGDLAQAALRMERAASFSETLEGRAARLLRAAAAAAQAGRPADDLFERAARAGRDTGVALQAMAMRALVASWQGDHDLVIELADEALRFDAARAPWPTAILIGLGCHISWNRLDLSTFARLWRALKDATATLDLSVARGPELMVLLELLQFRVLVDGAPVDDELLDVLLERIEADEELDIAPTAAFLLVLIDRPERSAALTTALRGPTDRNGAVAASVWLDAADAERLVSSGRPDEARQLANGAIARADALGLPWTVEVARAVALRCDALRGDLAGVRAGLEAAEHGLATPSLMLNMRASLGLCLLGRGDVAAARDHLTSLRGDAANALANPFFNRLHADLVECLVVLDELAAATEVAREYARHLTPSAGRLAAALLERVAGLVAPLDRAGEHFTAALSHHAAHHDAFERARTQLAWGVRLRRLRRPVDAQRHLGEAAATFRRIGATPWADRARHQAELAGARRSKPRAVGPNELTPQERAVIAEVARGRRNREIAATLFISPKTVEAHLTRIYRKLDVRSRTELLRWAASDQQK